MVFDADVPPATPRIRFDSLKIFDVAVVAVYILIWDPIYILSLYMRTHPHTSKEGIPGMLTIPYNLEGEMCFLPDFIIDVVNYVLYDALYYIILYLTIFYYLTFAYLLTYNSIICCWKSYVCISHKDGLR